MSECLHELLNFVGFFTMTLGAIKSAPKKLIFKCMSDEWLHELLNVVVFVHIDLGYHKMNRCQFALFSDACLSGCAGKAKRDEASDAKKKG